MIHGLPKTRVHRSGVLALRFLSWVWMICRLYEVPCRSDLSRLRITCRRSPSWVVLFRFEHMGYSPSSGFPRSYSSTWSSFQVPTRSCPVFPRLFACELQRCIVEMCIMNPATTITTSLSKTTCVREVSQTHGYTTSTLLLTAMVALTPDNY